MLLLPGWYKQATVGDVTGERPGMFAVSKRAKFDAWYDLRVMIQDLSVQQIIMRNVAQSGFVERCSLRHTFLCHTNMYTHLGIK